MTRIYVCSKYISINHCVEAVEISCVTNHRPLQYFQWSHVLIPTGYSLSFVNCITLSVIHVLWHFVMAPSIIVNFKGWDTQWSSDNVSHGLWRIEMHSSNWNCGTTVELPRGQLIWQCSKCVLPLSEYKPRYNYPTYKELMNHTSMHAYVTALQIWRVAMYYTK